LASQFSFGLVLIASGLGLDLGLTSLASLTSLIASVTVSRRDSTVDQQPSTVNWVDDLKTVRKTNEAIVKF